MSKITKKQLQAAAQRSVAIGEELAGTARKLAEEIACHKHITEACRQVLALSLSDGYECTMRSAMIVCERALRSLEK